MLKTLVNRWVANKHKVEAFFREQHPEDYKQILQKVTEAITSEDEYGELNLDPERVHQIDDGDYQGTLLFVIAEKGYQPCNYWFAKVGYGSCSGCDTLEGIRCYGDEKPTEQQVKDYMMLALHIVEWIKPMQEAAQGVEEE